MKIYPEDDSHWKQQILGFVLGCVLVVSGFVVLNIATAFIWFSVWKAMGMGR